MMDGTTQGHTTVIDAQDFPAIPPAKVVADGALTYTTSEDVVVFSDPAGERAESIAALRTHIMAQHLAAGRRSLAMCSPTPAVGCSSLAVNLAVALAESGVKTLLIDADMRHPSLERFITPSQRVDGLRQFLANPAGGVGEAIRFDVLPNLSLIYSGGVAERPQDLIASAAFTQLIDVCAREFAITIADTPPANASADARRVATVMGFALLVVGRDRTFVSDLNVFAEELVADHATVIGSVLNQR